MWHNISMDSQWLKIQFEVNPHKSKAGLAHALGLEPSAVSKILKGQRQIKAQEYAAMRRYFDLPVDGDKDLSYRHSPQTKDALGFLDKDRSNDTQDQWTLPAVLLTSQTAASPDSIKVIKVTDDAMAPEFSKGDYVLVDLSQQFPSPPGTFMVHDGFCHLIRQCEYMLGSSPKEVKISARNKNFEAQILKLDDFEVIGRVIAKLQWL